jgi:hypothetical protein
MLDRGLAHALAQVTDPIVMVGPEMKLLYANLAARKLTQDKPARLLESAAMRAANALMRAGKAQLPMALTIDFGAAAPAQATLFDWRAAGGFIVVVKPEVVTSRDVAIAAPLGAASPLPLLLKSGLSDELDRHFEFTEQALDTAAKTGEGESAGTQARSLRRSLAALLALSDATEVFASAAGERLSAASLIQQAWKSVAPLARERGVEVSMLGSDAASLDVGTNVVLMPWAFAEGLAYMVRRVPAGSATPPWRIEIGAFRAGVDTVVSIMSVGRIAPHDAASRTVLAAPPPSKGDATLPSSFGSGMPLVRAILTAIGGKFELLSENEENGKLLFRFPQTAA